MSDSKIFTGKLSRTLKTTSMAARSGVTHLGYLGAKQLSSNPEKLRQEHEEAIGKILFNGLSQMRGTALKASQLLSLETELLPEGIRQQLAKGCYQVPPINRALIRKVFKQEFGREAKALFKEFEPDAFAAASLGQVHKALSFDGTPLAVKIQYPGVRESISSDLKLLSTILKSVSMATNYLPKKSVIETTLDEMKICLTEEVDYQKEAENTHWFKGKLHEIGVYVPQVYSQYTNTRILSTEFLKGLHVEQWLATKPSQGRRDALGQKIFDSFLHCTFDLQCLHADPHMGNYLILNDDELAMLDFGCVKKLNEGFTKDYRTLVSAILAENEEQIFESYRTLKLIDNCVSYQDFNRQLQPILAPLQAWMCRPFRQAYFDFSTLPALPRTNDKDHKAAVKYLNDIPRDQMYYDRTYFGVYLLLKKIGARIKTENSWFTRDSCH